MPRRAVPIDPSVGERIRDRRTRRRWSIRQAASLAGIAHTTWMRIERGTMRTDRYMLADLAVALECSVTDLTGQPYEPADRGLERAHAQVDRVWRAMMAHPLTEPAGRDAPPMAGLAAESELVRDLYNRCDYAGTLERLVDLVPGLHAAARRGPNVDGALRLMVPVLGAAMGSLFNLGYPAHAWLAVERCQEAARHLEDAVLLAVAACNAARVASGSGAYSTARSAATRAAAELNGHLGAPGALETLGFLHLAAAHHSAGLKEPSVAFEHLDAAEDIAARTGETMTHDLAFGPANAGLWRMAVELDTGHPDDAIGTAGKVPFRHLPATRQVAYYIDVARGLVDLQSDERATQMLLSAERVAPQFTRSAASVRVTVRTLRDRAGGAGLRGLCERLGVS